MEPHKSSRPHPGFEAHGGLTSVSDYSILVVCRIVLKASRFDRACSGAEPALWGRRAQSLRRNKLNLRLRTAWNRPALNLGLRLGNIVPSVYTPLLAKDSETEGPEVGLQEFRQIGTGKCPRVYECYWAHFAAEIHLSE